MNRFVLFVAAAAVCLSSASASASVKFCIRIDTFYEDNNFGETNWLTDVERNVRGARVTVKKSGVTQPLYDSYLGDGLGTNDNGLSCTSTLSPSTDNGTYSIDVWSYAYVNNNWVTVKSNATGIAYKTTFSYSHTGGAGTFNVDVVIPTAEAEKIRAFNVFNAALYAVYRHNGDLGLEDFMIRYDDTNGETNGYESSSTQEVKINQNRYDNKFAIVHELGHRLGHLAVGDKLVGTTGDAPDGVCDPEPSTAETTMRSMEWQEAAASEGFAHFYAADVWNDHDANACKFRYYRDVWVPTPSPGSWQLLTVDCESGITNFAEAYMESKPCSDSNGMKGKGVELDWLRTFWDMHKGGGVSFNEIVHWMADTADWNEGHDGDVYFILDLAAFAKGGSFNARWDDAVTANGIAHPM